MASVRAAMLNRLQNSMNLALGAIHLVIFAVFIVLSAVP